VLRRDRSCGKTIGVGHGHVLLAASTPVKARIYEIRTCPMPRPRQSSSLPTVTERHGPSVRTSRHAGSSPGDRGSNPVTAGLASRQTSV
jgi:hypothetical protein